MAKSVKLRQGTFTEHEAFTGDMAEVTFDTTNNRIILHDGTTPGGIPMARMSDVPVDLTDLTDVDDNLSGTPVGPIAWVPIVASNIVPEFKSLPSRGTITATVPTHSSWSNDGTKLYTVTHQPSYTTALAHQWPNGRVDQFDVSTAWDISTATRIASSTQWGGSSQPNVIDLHINSDGTKLYIVTVETVETYALSTPYDITTASSTATGTFNTWTITDTSNKDFRWNSMSVSPDETKIYLIGRYNHHIKEYSMSTAGDVTTMSPTGNNIPMKDTLFDASYDYLRINASSPLLWGLFMPEDGLHIYVCATGASNSKIGKWTMTTAWDLSTATETSSELIELRLYTPGHPTFSPHLDQNTGAYNEGMADINFSKDGTKLYAGGLSANIGSGLFQYDVSGTLTQNLTLQGLPVEDNMGAPTQYMDESKFSSNWNARADLPGKTVFSANDVYGLTFSADGMHCYYTSGSSARDVKTVRQLALTTAWDISTMSHVRYQDLNATPPLGGPAWTGIEHHDISISTDGTKFYSLDMDTRSIVQYTLATPYDISSFSRVEGKDVLTLMLAGDECNFNISYDGKIMFVHGGQPRHMRKFKLATPWDISTAYATGWQRNMGGSDAHGMSADGMYEFRNWSATSFKRKDNLAPWDLSPWDSTTGGTGGADFDPAPVLTNFKCPGVDDPMRKITISTDGRTLIVYSTGTSEIISYDIGT